MKSTLFGSDGGFIRIPVWGHIPLTMPMKKILSHPTFLRLKGIKQLSFAHHVFPGATHTRFEHSIGVYHLTKLILQRLVTNPLTASLQTKEFSFDEDSCRLILASSLLHDIGHYPHAHIVEKIPLSSKGEIIFSDHQDLTNQFLNEHHNGFGTLAEILERDWKLDSDEVSEMVTGRKKLKFSKLISGTLDPDKMDYLMRDAHHCNIPYGSIDIERLIESFVPDVKRKRFAITEKGIASMESLMFAKYMMMRNVYWHHTSRTLAAMLTRLIQDAMDESKLTAEKLREVFYSNLDDRILPDLSSAINEKEFASLDLLTAIDERRPYKRALTLRADDEAANAWMYELNKNAGLRKEKEIAICDFLNKKYKLKLKGHEVLIDSPSIKNIFDHKDFCELQLYRVRKGKGEFIPFDSCEESAFHSKFILEFEKTTKKFRVVAEKNIVEKLIANESKVLEILKD